MSRDEGDLSALSTALQIVTEENVSGQPIGAIFD
jgi:hypothetical protein